MQPLTTLLGNCSLVQTSIFRFLVMAPLPWVMCPHSVTRYPIFQFSGHHQAFPGACTAAAAVFVVLTEQNRGTEPTIGTSATSQQVQPHRRPTAGFCTASKTTCDCCERLDTSTGMDLYSLALLLPAEEEQDDEVGEQSHSLFWTNG